MTAQGPQGWDTWEWQSIWPLTKLVCTHSAGTRRHTVEPLALSLQQGLGDLVGPEDQEDLDLVLNIHLKK